MPMTVTEMIVAFVPSMAFIEVIDTELMPGPATRNNNAAPGLNPFKINAAAIGTDALEQT